MSKNKENEVKLKILKLDYSIQSPEERKKVVEQIIRENPNLSEKYLTILANYLIFCMEKEEKKDKKILTDNRLTTVNKRETSLEGIVSQLENGEDGIYNLLEPNNKRVIFQPKISITKKDLEEIPGLRQLQSNIQDWEARLKKASGKEAYMIKKSLIEMRKEQYLIKQEYRKPVSAKRITHAKFPIDIECDEWVAQDGSVQYTGLSLCDPKICTAILCNYAALKNSSREHFQDDIYYLLEDFENLREKALADYPQFQVIYKMKIDGYQNTEIQRALLEQFGSTHSLEYISNLWRKKIPNLIASVAEDQFLDWYYLNVEKGKYKRCSRCGKIKLAHNKYFSKNSTSKDGYYSICKECRNKKTKKEGE